MTTHQIATNAAQQYGINLTDAQQLPGRCGQHVNLIACLATATGLSGNFSGLWSPEKFFGLREFPGK
ncbi:unnamed protein product [Camellia sinensis]